MSPPTNAMGDTAGDCTDLERLKGAFLGSLSHEFRTPLNAILGYLEILEDSASLADARRLHGLVRHQAAAMLAMLDNSLVLTDLRLGRVTAVAEPVDLAAIQRPVAREVERLWRRPGVRLALEIAPGLPPVWVDRRAVGQIVRNLLMNALASTEAGAVRLAASAVPDAETIEVAVTDDGPGISPLDAPTLFEEYTALRTGTCDRYIEGLGIGLAVARRLAELTGGSLVLESPGERGACFRLRMPRASGIAAPPATRDPGARRDSPAAAGARASIAEPAETASSCPEAPVAEPGAPIDRPSAARAGARREGGAFRCPPFPALLGAITRALQDPTAHDREIGRTARADEALAATLLHYANTAALPRRAPARTVEQALTIVGLARLRALVLTRFVHSLFSRWGRVETFLWEHALASALASERLAGAAGASRDELYLCGLLHNVGKVLLNDAERAGYAAVISGVVREGMEFADAERAHLGRDHAAVGAAMLAGASLPDQVRWTAAAHHAAGGADAAICHVLLVADAVAYRVSRAWADLRAGAEQPAWLAARLAAGADLAPDARDLEDGVAAELERMRDLLRL
jgi:putative nucleotidyltransferase with HDIG domain